MSSEISEIGMERGVLSDKAPMIRVESIVFNVPGADSVAEEAFAIRCVTGFYDEKGGLSNAETPYEPGDMNAAVRSGLVSIYGQSVMGEEVVPPRLVPDSTDKSMLISRPITGGVTACRAVQQLIDGHHKSIDEETSVEVSDPVWFTFIGNTAIVGLLKELKAQKEENIGRAHHLEHVVGRAGWSLDHRINLPNKTHWGIELSDSEES